MIQARQSLFDHKILITHYRTETNIYLFDDS